MAEAVAELPDLDIEAASADIAIALSELAREGLIDV